MRSTTILDTEMLPRLLDRSVRFNQYHDGCIRVSRHLGELAWPGCIRYSHEKSTFGIMAWVTFCSHHRYSE
ncbi:hypothetical protein TNCV_1249121 [Trichonephila clavipes]|nr:hypothetical protein TNCV_1249121 [Trichonephila clavipes]